MCIRVGKTKKGQLVEESKKGMAFHFNENYRQHPDKKIVLLFDFTDAGVSNMVNERYYLIKRVIVWS